MSTTHKRPTHRLALLASASFALAGAATVLTPTQARAADECGPATGTQACTGTFAAIDYPVTTGNLTLQLANDLVVTTGGLEVTATGTRTVSITRTNTPVGGGDPKITNTSGAGVSITTETGGITYNVTDPAPTSGDGAMISGTTAGVRLHTASTLTVTSTTGTIAASGGAGLDLAAGVGGTVNITNGTTTAANPTATISGTTAAIALTGGGTVTLTNNLTGRLEGSVNLANTGNTTVTNAGRIAGVLNLANTGNATVTNTGQITGALNLTNTGNTTVTNSGEWRFSGASSLRDLATATGSATLTNNASGKIVTNLDGEASSIDFGTGGATFANSGLLAVGHGTEGAATLTLNGLATWNNSGRVLFGASEDLNGSDGVANDRVVMARAGGGTFTGSGNSRFIMDVDFGASQLDCSAAVTADCLDLRGMNTAGTTSIVVNTAGTGGTPERVVLVDASGAGTDAAVFTLSPDSSTYRDMDGGLIDGGVFLYALSHDAEAQQHVLEAVAADGEALQLSMVSRQASEPWRVATGMWHDRQADLRNSIAGRAAGYSPGAWLKLAGGFIDETRFDDWSIGDDSMRVDSSYAQDTTALVGGIDLLRFIGEDSAWVVGVTAGKVESTVSFDAGESEIDLDGHSLGVYGSLLFGRLFVDGIVNTTDLDLTQTGFGQTLESAAKSTGYQVEAGYRAFQFNDGGAWIEPLVSVSYVTTEVDELAMGSAVAEYGDTSALRHALGLRLGGDLAMKGLTATFSATGRYWTQTDSENTAVLSAGFGDTELRDKGFEQLGDLGVAVSLFTLGNRLSAHLAYNVLFNDDYQNTGAGFGLRYNW